MSKPHKAAVPYFELLPMVIAPEWNRCWPTSAKRKEKEIWSCLFARVPSPFLPLLTILVASRFVTPSPRFSRPNGTLSSIKWWQWNYHAHTTIIGDRSHCIAMIRPTSSWAFGKLQFCWQTSDRLVCRSVIDQLHTWAEHLKNVSYFAAKILNIFTWKWSQFFLWIWLVLFFYIFYMYIFDL